VDAAGWVAEERERGKRKEKEERGKRKRKEKEVRGKRKRKEERGKSSGSDLEARRFCGFTTCGDNENAAMARGGCDSK
jgi:hypothetical protein